MATSEAFEALKVFMIENYGAKAASGGKEIVKRCHFCGDSKDRSSRHMYIGMRDGLIVYNCFKCQAHGIVDGDFFRSLGCYNVDIISICAQNNSKNGTYRSMSAKHRFVKTSAPILTYRNGPETEKKVAYLYKRLGYHFSLEDLARFKIILNLYDYISANAVGTLTRYKDICDQLDQFFIGFLSADNAYINMRKLVPDGKLHKNIDTKYVNYNIYGFYDNSSRYYIIPTKVDVSKKIKIHIAEGVFDILGVYLNTDSDKSNSIFASIGGKSYLSLIQYFILNYGFINYELHIYVDNDISNYEIMKIRDLLRPYYVDVYMHHNLQPGQKDYGVSRENIVDGVIKL